MQHAIDWTLTFQESEALRIHRFLPGAITSFDWEPWMPWNYAKRMKLGKQPQTPLICTQAAANAATCVGINPYIALRDIRLMAADEKVEVHVDPYGGSIKRMDSDFGSTDLRLRSSKRFGDRLVHASSY